MLRCLCGRCVRLRAVLTMALALPAGDAVRADAIDLISPRLAAHVSRPPLAARVMAMRPFRRAREREEAS